MSSRRSRSLTAPERPRGGRWRRPAWKDPRMAGGVVLVRKGRRNLAVGRAA